jgi:signal transduction histidine kinase
LCGIAIKILYVYYYTGTEKYLTKKLNDVKSVFTKFSLEDSVESDNIVADIVENFAYKDETELLVLDKNGNVAFSSLGANSQEKTGYISSEKNLKPNGFSCYKGKVNGDSIMVVSTALADNSSKYSALRVVSSLEKIDSNFTRFVWLIVALCLFILLLILALSLLFINSLLRDIASIKYFSEKLLSNESYSERIPRKHNDEIGELATNINKLANVVKSNNNTQFEFLTTVSHELRTPLSIINGNVDYALNTIPDIVVFGIGEGKATITLQEQEIIRKRLTVIKSTIKILVDMIDMITDFAKSNIDRIKYNMTKIDVIAELTDAILGLQDKAKNNNVILTDIYSEAMEQLQETAINPCIIGDSNALRRVFINVIDNAIKYSEPDKGVVRINVEMNEDEVQIIVTDNGCGISQEDLPKIKTRFFRAKNASAVRGTGIGLSISEEIVRAFKGFLDITSDGIGKGTTVIITLPLDNS